MKLNFLNTFRNKSILFNKFLNNRFSVKKVKKIPYVPQSTTYFKEYQRLDKINLLKPQIIKNYISEALIKRGSTRNFSTKKLTLKEISTILIYSAGINNRNPNHRFYPSAGAKYPLEVYLISLNSEISKGIYHFNIKKNYLELINKDFDLKKMFYQPWKIENSSIIIVITSIFFRNMIKYGNRGYRYVLIEAGHVGQNIDLLCSSLNIGVCAVGGYYDINLNEYLNIYDDNIESSIYAFAIGNKI